MHGLLDRLTIFSEYRTHLSQRKKVQRHRRVLDAAVQSQGVSECCASVTLAATKEFTETLHSLSVITGIFFNHYHSCETVPLFLITKKKKKRWDFRALALPSLAQTPSGTVAHVGLFNPHTDKTLHAGEEWGWKKKKKNSGAEKVTTFYLRKKIIYNCMRTLNKTGIYYVVKMVLI